MAHHYFHETPSSFPLIRSFISTLRNIALAVFVILGALFAVLLASFAILGFYLFLYLLSNGNTSLSLTLFTVTAVTLVSIITVLLLTDRFPQMTVSSDR
jgi:hypothetical protein